MIVDKFNDFILRFTNIKQSYKFAKTRFIFLEEFSKSDLNFAKNILTLKQYFDKNHLAKQMLISLADIIMKSDTDYLLLLNLKYFLNKRRTQHI